MDYRRWPKRKDVGRNRENEFLMPLAKGDETKTSWTPRLAVSRRSLRSRAHCVLSKILAAPVGEYPPPQWNPLERQVGYYIWRGSDFRPGHHAAAFVIRGQQKVSEHREAKRGEGKARFLCTVRIGYEFRRNHDHSWRIFLITCSS